MDISAHSIYEHTNESDSDMKCRQFLEESKL